MDTVTWSDVATSLGETQVVQAPAVGACVSLTSMRYADYFGHAAVTDGLAPSAPHVAAYVQRVLRVAGTNGCSATCTME